MRSGVGPRAPDATWFYYCCFDASGRPVTRLPCEECVSQPRKIIKRRRRELHLEGGPSKANHGAAQGNSVPTLSGVTIVAHHYGHGAAAAGRSDQGGVCWILGIDFYARRLGLKDDVLH